MKKLFFTLMSFIALVTTSKAQTTTLTVSTPTNWVATGSPTTTTTVTTFYGHSNWMKLGSHTAYTDYKFVRSFYVCQAGTFTFNGKGMGNNHMVLKIDGSTLLFDRNIEDAAGFNSPSTFNQTVQLACGQHFLEVTIADDNDGNAGFYVDATITTNNGLLSDKPCNCSCCGNIETAKILGPTQITCSQPATFRIDSCKDVNRYTWSFSPTIPAYQIVGQGTSTVTVNPSIALGTYTVNLAILCNGKTYTKTYTFTVTAIQNCRPNFLVSTTEISATNYSVTAVPSLSTAGISHYFVIYNTNTCGGSIGSQVGTISYKPNGSIAYSSSGVTTAGASNNGINYKNLVKGQCYVVRHYVLCCGQWICLQKCVCMGKDGSCKNPPKDFDSYDVIEKEIMIDAKELPEEIKKLEAGQGRG